MRKRLLAALVCAVLTLTLLPAVALAANDITDTGLDLSTNAPTGITTYTAGGGTVVWDPTPTTAPATLTFNNARIAVDNAHPLSYTYAVKLPDRPITVIFKGTNSIAADSAGSAYAFRCYDDTVFNLTAGSDTTINAGMGRSPQSAYGINADSTAEIKGAGKLNINVRGLYGFPISADASLYLTGGTLAFRINNAYLPYSGTYAASATLGGVTISDGETLDLSAVTGSVAKGASGAVNNGELVLKDGTTPAQIAALGLTGSGTVKVGSDTYTNGGQRMYTSRMDFSQTAALGGWKENATLAEDGYNFTGSASSGYTLTLGNLLMKTNSSDSSIVLPTDGPVRVVLADGTTARITNVGDGANIEFPKTGTSYPCTITGGGQLILTADNNGRSCIDTEQPLTIAGGDIAMVNNSGYTCIDAHDTALTISGGRLDMNANTTAVTAGSVTLLNGITSVSPAGAQFLDGNFRLDGNMVARLILGVQADVPKTGDDTPLLLLCGLLLLSGAGLVAMRRRKRV